MTRRVVSERGTPPMRRGTSGRSALAGQAHTKESTLAHGAASDAPTAGWAPVLERDDAMLAAAVRRLVGQVKPQQPATDDLLRLATLLAAADIEPILRRRGSGRAALPGDAGARTRAIAALWAHGAAEP